MKNFIENFLIILAFFTVSAALLLAPALIILSLNLSVWWLLVYIPILALYATILAEIL